MAACFLSPVSLKLASALEHGVEEGWRDDCWARFCLLHFFPQRFELPVCLGLSRIWLFATPWAIAHQDVCPWGSPGKHTRVDCHFVLQRIFLTQGSNPGLPPCRQILYCLSHREAPWATRVYNKNPETNKTMSGEAAEPYRDHVEVIQ